MTEGRPFMPAVLIAITKGDLAAVLACRFKSGLVYDLVPLTDVAGPTGWDPNVQALVVSKETLSGAAASMSQSFSCAP